MTDLPSLKELHEEAVKAAKAAHLDASLDRAEAGDWAVKMPDPIETAIQAYLSTLQSSGVKLVGREPTREMMDAVFFADQRERIMDYFQRNRAHFHAMFDAAPSFGEAR